MNVKQGAKQLRKENLNFFQAFFSQWRSLHL